MRWLWMIITLAAVGGVLALPHQAKAADYVVYNVYRALDLGNPGETPQKDFYVNMGTAQGLHEGSVLSVHRRVPTYDLISEKLYRDVTFSIARLKVIHAESNAAVARLDRMLPSDKTPSVTPFAVMVGDIVRRSE